MVDLEAADVIDVADVILSLAQNMPRSTFGASTLFASADEYMSDESVVAPPHDRRARARLTIGEAIQYLFSQTFLAMSGDTGAGEPSFQVTRLGRTIKTRQNFDSYAKAALLPSELLHPDLATARSTFLSGNYDSAVFEAFLQLEVAVRAVSPSLTASNFGMPLMRKAFEANGPLADTFAIDNERDACAHLFAGAIGYFKNPQSHRNVGLDEATAAASQILVASALLRVVSSHHARAVATSTAKALAKALSS